MSDNVQASPLKVVRLFLAAGVLALAWLVLMLWAAALGEISKYAPNIGGDYVSYGAGMAAMAFAAVVCIARTGRPAVAYAIPFIVLAWDAKLGGLARSWLALDALAIVTVVLSVASGGRRVGYHALVGAGLTLVKAMPYLAFATSEFPRDGLHQWIFNDEVFPKYIGALLGGALPTMGWFALLAVAAGMFRETAAAARPVSEVDQFEAATAAK